MKKLFLSAAIGALAITPSLAVAQPAPSLGVGASLSGELTARDAAQADGAKFDEYALTLRAGQGVVITMEAEGFDSVLEIGRGRGAAFESLASDDDGGGGTNSRLRYRAEEGGVFTVRARGFDGQSAGAYTLTSRERITVAEPAPAELPIGATVTGQLADGGPRTDAEDRLYARYAVTGKAGQRVMVSMKSSAFDSVVELGRGDGASFQTIASDDDGGGENNARLLTVLPEDGAYIIRALGFEPNAAGAFEISYAELPPAGRPGRPTRLQGGRIVSGDLSFGDAEGEAFKFYDLYELRGAAGQGFLVSLRSKAFDSFLEAGANTSLGFAVAQSDDDSGGDLDSQLTVTFERAGVILLRASSLQPGATGAYSVSVEPAPQ